MAQEQRNKPKSKPVSGDDLEYLRNRLKLALMEKGEQGAKIVQKWMGKGKGK